MKWSMHPGSQPTWLPWDNLKGNILILTSLVSGIAMKIIPTTTITGPVAIMTCGKNIAHGSPWCWNPCISMLTNVCKLCILMKNKCCAHSELVYFIGAVHHRLEEGVKKKNMGFVKWLLTHLGMRLTWLKTCKNQWGMKCGSFLLNHHCLEPKSEKRQGWRNLTLIRGRAGSVGLVSFLSPKCTVCLPKLLLAPWWQLLTNLPMGCSYHFRQLQY